MVAGQASADRVTLESRFKGPAGFRTRDESVYCSCLLLQLCRSSRHSTLLNHLTPPPVTNTQLKRREVSAGRRELWRPPAFSGGTTAVSRAFAAVRRFFDIQEATIWRDLARLLSDVSGTVLDVGCGAQPFRGLLPDGTRYRGIDTIDAKERFGYEVPDVLYFDGGRWPVEDASADVILCTEVLEHVFDVEAFLGEARRCSRPRGMLVLTVPFAARWHYAPHDYWRFTPSSLALLLDQAGFTDVRVYQRGNPITVAAYKAMALLLPIIMPQTNRIAPRVALLLPGVLATAVLAGLAGIAQLSLAFDYGEDCLGYTLVATKAGEPAQALADE